MIDVRAVVIVKPLAGHATHSVLRLFGVGQPNVRADGPRRLLMRLKVSAAQLARSHNSLDGTSPHVMKYEPHPDLDHESGHRREFVGGECLP